MDFGWLFFSFEGRLNRAKFWAALFGIGIIAYVFNLFVGGTFDPYDPSSPVRIVILSTVVFAWPYLAVATKRFHDVGLPGGWSVLVLIPVFALLPNLFLGIKKGDVGDNEYGVDPLAGTSMDGTASVEDGTTVTTPSKTQTSSQPAVTRLQKQADTSVLDTKEWSILVKYDKAVQAGIETIAGLDRGSHEKFAAEMLQAEPSSRKADETARRLIEEHQNYWKLSERAEINEALREISSLASDMEAEFRAIYSIVGDEMDVNEVVTDLKLKHEQKSQLTVSLNREKSAPHSKNDGTAALDLALVLVGIFSFLLFLGVLMVLTA